MLVMVVCVINFALQTQPQLTKWIKFLNKFDNASNFNTHNQSWKAILLYITNILDTFLNWQMCGRWKQQEIAKRRLIACFCCWGWRYEFCNRRDREEGVVDQRIQYTGVWLEANRAQKQSLKGQHGWISVLWQLSCR